MLVRVRHLSHSVPARRPLDTTEWEIRVETIEGKHARKIDAPELARRLAGYTHVLIDLGTGDGRFVRTVAAACPTTFAIGVDACRENLRECSRTAPANTLYVIANALALPRELDGMATCLTINFPWGSLLAGLLAGDPALVERLAALTRPGALLEVRLNAGALADAGWPLEEAGQRVRQALHAAGFSVRRPVILGSRELWACPTTWARRLAFGRDPRALSLQGHRTNTPYCESPPNDNHQATVLAARLNSDILSTAGASTGKGGV
jgi:16S rRNA (adenine(1408)-N(1))-methyltransferase